MLAKLVVIYVGLLIPIWYFYKTIKLLVNCLIGWGIVIKEFSRVSRYKVCDDNSLNSELSQAIKDALEDSVLSERATCITILVVIALLAIVAAMVIVLWILYFRLLFTGQIQGIIEQLLSVIGK